MLVLCRIKRGQKFIGAGPEFFLSYSEILVRVDLSFVSSVTAGFVQRPHRDKRMPFISG
jgi:hypothetical protein